MNKRILVKNGKAFIDEKGKVLSSSNVGSDKTAQIKINGVFEGTPIPNRDGAYVEKIYLNTKLK